MGVDRYRICELYAAGPESEGSGSGYRLSDRLVLTARHVVVPALAGVDGRLLVRPVGVSGWLPARVQWQDADADVALVAMEDEDWQAPAQESVLRWGELVGSDPVPCAAVGFPWASVRPDRMRDTAHVYGQLAPLGQLRQGRLDLDVASPAPLARSGGSPWAGMSGAGVIADNYLVGVITVDPARYQDRLVAVPVTRVLADPGFRALLVDHRVQTEAAPIGAEWYLRLPGEQTVCLAAPYQPVSRRFIPAPSTLLRSEHGLVPFLGRQALLKRITDWCRNLSGKPLMLMIGSGGSGKTRLGREACVQMLVAGWDAGLADDMRRDGAAITRLQRPTLLVVDDAELHTGLIASLVDYLRWDDAGPPVGLLLLARAAGDWWERLVRQQELVSAHTILDLDRYPVPVLDRAEHFRRASTAFTAYGGPGAQSVEAPPTVRLDDPVYAEPLLIHISALLRLEGSSGASALLSPGEKRSAEDISEGAQDSPVRQQLLQALCERERALWYELGKELDLPFRAGLPLADQIVALVTLTAAGDQDCAMSLLAALPNQEEVTRIGAEALVVWAHQLYAGPDYWNPLRPDLLAEQHLADTAQLSRLVTTAAQLADGKGWEAGLLTQMLAELTRGAPNQPAVRAALSDLLVTALPRIVRLAVTTDHAELADFTSVALELAPQPALAATLADQMPRYSVRLAALAATLTGQQVVRYRINTTDAEPEAANRLGRSLTNFAVRLSELGRAEDALAASEESVAIRRELTAAHPDAFRPDLSESLTNLSVHLNAMGRAQDALAAIEEAVTIQRELATSQDRFQADLAGSLNNLSNLLHGLGRAQDALAASEESVAIRRKLAASRPDMFHADLAGSLTNLSNRQGGLGRAQDALAASEEAVTIYRELATSRPDTFRADLAGSLTNLSICLARVGRAEDALGAGDEAVTIYRELATSRPDTFRPKLASTLYNQSISLGRLGRAQDALAVGEEAVAIYRELASFRAEAFRADLAGSLTNLSNCLADLSREDDALAARQEAITIYRELAASRPDTFGPNLAELLTILWGRLGLMGRREDALAAIKEAITIYRELAASRPDTFGPNLADSLTYLSISLSPPEDALAAAKESVTIYRELAASRPDSFRAKLADSLDNLALLLAGRLNRLSDALSASEQAVTIYRELAASRPDTFGPYLARSLTRLSNLLGLAGRWEDHRIANEEAATILQEVNARSPDI